LKCPRLIPTIFTRVKQLLNEQVSPLELTTVIYESDKNYILVKEVSNGSVLMAITKNRQEESFNMVLNALTGKDFQNLKTFLTTYEL
jgi:hypothetical protein